MNENQKKVPRTESSESYEILGIIVKDNGTMIDSEGNIICDTSFVVENYYEVISSEGNYYELEIKPHKVVRDELTNRMSQKDFPSVKIRPQELKTDRWILKTYGGQIHINGLNPQAYKLIREKIYCDLKDIKPTRVLKEMGWSGDFKNGYVFGNEILHSNLVDFIDIRNGKPPKPHESLREFRLAYSSISEIDALQFIRDVYLPSTKPMFVSKTLLMVSLLSLVTSLLNKSPEKPNFVTVIRGLSGSRKSSWMTVAMHIVEKYKGTVMTNFTGTLPGILQELMINSDTVVSVDDLYPCGKSNYDKMTQIFTILIRIYADNAKRVVFGKSYSAPPNMLLTTCEEVPKNLAPSDYARMLILTFKHSTVDLSKLSTLQSEHQKHSAFIRYFIIHMANLCEKYTEELMSLFKLNQFEMRNELSNIPGRLQSTGAWLISQYSLFLDYRIKVGEMEAKSKEKEILSYKSELIQHMKEQSSEFSEINPTRIFCQAIDEILKKGELELKEVLTQNGKNVACFSANEAIKGDASSLIFPEKLLGFTHNGYYYLVSKKAYSAVKKHCYEQGFPFVFSERRILSIIKENGLLSIDKDDKACTTRFQVNGKQFRFLKIAHHKFKEFLRGDEYDNELE